MNSPALPVAVALVAAVGCSSPSKPHPTSGGFEQCYYDCKPGQQGAGSASAPAGGASAATASAPKGKLTPAGE